MLAFDSVDPSKGSVIEGGVAPMLEGEEASGDNYYCGGCDTLLLKNVKSTAIQAMMFRCPGCKKINDKKFAVTRSPSDPNTHHEPGPKDEIPQAVHCSRCGKLLANFRGPVFEAEDPKVQIVLLDKSAGLVDLQCPCGAHTKISSDHFKGVGGVALISGRGMKFENQTVYLSGHVYKDCEFYRCTFVYAGGHCVLDNVRMTNCILHIDTMIYDAGHVETVMKIIQTIAKSLPRTA